MLGIVAVAAISSPGTGAAPVDGDMGFARSLSRRQAAGATPVSARQRATISSPGADANASLANIWSDAPKLRLRYSHTLTSAGPPDGIRIEQITAQEQQVELREHRITVRPGDSLYTIFKARGLARQDLAAIMAAGKSTSGLARLHPGDRIRVYTDVANRVQGLSHQRGGGKILNVARDAEAFRAGAKARPENAVILSAGAENGAADNSITSNSVD